MIQSLPTVTVSVSVKEWLGSESQASKELLLQYLEDIADELPLKGQATAAALESIPELWFTFIDYEDAQLFETAVYALWADGEWLS